MNLISTTRGHPSPTNSPARRNSPPLTSNSNSCKELSALCKEEPLCAICMCEVDAEEEAEFCNKWCSEEHEATCSCHIECMQHLIKSVVDSAFSGSCPVISCPCLHRTKKAMEGKSKSGSPVQNGSALFSPRGSFVAEYPQTTFIVPYSTWSAHMIKIGEDALVLKHKQLAANLMPFLCGSCHMQRSIQETYANPEVPGLPTPAPGTTAVLPRKRTAMEELVDWQPGESMLQAVRRKVHGMQYVNHNSFEATLRMYLCGRISVDDFYRFLSQSCFGSPQTVPFGDFRLVLQLIEDPERRNNLHLRYLRDHREFLTTCCKAKHCWTCKSRPHPRISCEQNNNSLDTDIVECTGCGISLAKGDGCDALRCVCGKSFNWAAEKKAYGLSMEFVTAYPSNTIHACAIHMYDVPLQALAPDAGEADPGAAATPNERIFFMSKMAPARAFRHKNASTVNGLMLQLFAKENGPVRMYRGHSAAQRALTEKTLAMRFLLAKREERELSLQAAAEQAADENIPLLGLERGPVIPGPRMDKFYTCLLPTQIVAMKLAKGDPRILLEGSGSNFDTIITSLLGSESAARLWFEQHKVQVLKAVSDIFTSHRSVLDAFYSADDTSTKLTVKCALEPVTITTAVLLEQMQRPHLRAIDDPYGFAREPNSHLLANALSSAARRADNAAVKAHEAAQAASRTALFSRFYGSSKVLESNNISETGRSLLPCMRTRLYNLWNKTYEVLCEEGMSGTAVTAAALRWDQKARALCQAKKVRVSEAGTCEDENVSSDMLVKSLTSASHLSLLSLLMNVQVAPFTLASAAQYELVTLDLVHTWDDVWDSSMYAIKCVLRSKQYDVENLVKDFEQEFGDSCYCVAAHACYESLTRQRAVAFMQAKPEAMNEWYKADQSSGDPLINARWGCRCLPRHLSDQLCHGVHREEALEDNVTNFAGAFRHGTLADYMREQSAVQGASQSRMNPGPLGAALQQQITSRGNSVAVDAAALAHHFMWPNEPVNPSQSLPLGTRSPPNEPTELHRRPAPPPAPLLHAAHSRQVAADFSRAAATITSSPAQMQSSSRAMHMAYSSPPPPPAPASNSPPTMRPTIVSHLASQPTIVRDDRQDRVRSGTATSRDSLLSAIIAARHDHFEARPTAASLGVRPSPLRTGSHWSRTPGATLPPPYARPVTPPLVRESRDAALSPTVRTSSVTDLIERFETRSSAWRTIRDSSAPVQEREAAQRQVTEVMRNTSPQALRPGFNSPFEHGSGEEAGTAAAAAVSAVSAASRSPLLAAIRHAAPLAPVAHRNLTSTETED